MKRAGVVGSNEAVQKKQKIFDEKKESSVAEKEKKERSVFLGPYGPVKEKKSENFRDEESEISKTKGIDDKSNSEMPSKFIDSDRLSIAPMMAWTNRHFRFLIRQMTAHTKLYTEMLVDDTLIHQKHNLTRFLGFNPSEHPVVVQLGGSDPEKLAEAAALCEQWGYDEINLNCGCPSKKVSKRCFGARLMLQPELVKKITYTLRRRVQIPVTVKCRLGADNKESYEELCHFVKTVSETGVSHFLVHARKCILNGLSTAQNRSIPPLKYGWVHQLVKDFRHLDFSLNGHVQTLGQVNAHLNAHIDGGKTIDMTPPPPRKSVLVSHPSSTGASVPKGLKGVMIGRAAYNTPWIFLNADKEVFGEEKNPLETKDQLINNYIDYCIKVQQDEGYSKRLANMLVKPVLHLFNGTPKVRMYKQAINHAIHKEKKTDVSTVLRGALDVLR
mmetsp:Transcript_12597/g.18840  ORF Transcript_12597/g.18840 Transcript_12597/m.18840 type:complete len:443 (+) Transcript_12597:93-1421(+)